MKNCCENCLLEFPKKYKWAYFQGKKVCQHCFRRLRHHNGRKISDVRAYAEFLKK